MHKDLVDEGREIFNRRFEILRGIRAGTHTTDDLAMASDAFRDWAENHALTLLDAADRDLNREVPAWKCPECGGPNQVLTWTAGSPKMLRCQDCHYVIALSDLNRVPVVGEVG